MQLWQKNLLSIAICEKGFSKQSVIKSHLWVSLKFDTLDVLIRISLCNIGMDNMDWR
jgi:hypothetical protein